MEKASGPLELHFGDAATPERVEAAAWMIREMLSAVCPSLADDSVTMVVSNLSMSVGVRGRTPEAKQVVQRLRSFVRAPGGYLARHPEHGAMADAILAFEERAKLSSPMVVTNEHGGRTLATLDAGYLETLRGIQQADQAGAGISRGTTTIYSKVLRVGRTAEGRQLQARLILDGRPEEIRVDGDAAVFFDLAKSGSMARVTIRAAWRRMADGKLWLVANQSVALDAAVVTLSNGKAVLAKLLAASNGLREMSDEEFDARMRGMKASRW